MSDRRTHVTIDPYQPSKVKVIIDGPTCSTFNVLTRDEARILAALITQCLMETEEPCSTKQPSQG
jgi:hypothetical protein